MWEIDEIRGIASGQADFRSRDAPTASFAAREKRSVEVGLVFFEAMASGKVSIRVLLERRGPVYVSSVRPIPTESEQGCEMKSIFSIATLLTVASTLTAQETTVNSRDELTQAVQIPGPVNSLG